MRRPLQEQADAPRVRAPASAGARAHAPAAGGGLDDPARPQPPHAPERPDPCIRVLIAEDHGIVRAGLLQLLVNATDMEVVGLAARGVEAVELVCATRPDVVLMDLAMPDLDGIGATRAIVATAPQVRVLILTAFSDEPHVLAALDAGAAGYLLKDSGPGALYGAIRAVHRGEAPLAGATTR